jgi:Mg2+ and Co2+ transporter CorA
MFGMNVGGLPWLEHPKGFWWVIVVMLLAVVVTLFLLRKRKVF